MSALKERLHVMTSLVVWKPGEATTAQLTEFDRQKHIIRMEIEQREKQMLDCVVTLDVIAAWELGAYHDGNIQQWNAAQLARTQLAALGITGPLNQERPDEPIR